MSDPHDDNNTVDLTEPAHVEEETTTPTASNPLPPDTDAHSSTIPAATSAGARGEWRGGEVKGSLKSASWKSVTPDFAAPLPFQSMIIVEEFEVEGSEWSGKAWQMVTTYVCRPGERSVEHFEECRRRGM